MGLFMKNDSVDYEELKRVNPLPWAEAEKKYKGSYRGKRVARVIDITLGGDLVVLFGNYRFHCFAKHVTQVDFDAWCSKYKVKLMGPSSNG